MRRRRADRWRLSVAVLLVLLMHAVLLSLTFGGADLGRPGFGLPWLEPRIKVSDVRVTLVPARARDAKAAKTVKTTETADGPVAEPTRPPTMEPPADALPALTPDSDFTTDASPAQAPAPVAVVVERTEEEAPAAVPAAPPRPMPVLAAATRASSPETGLVATPDVGDLPPLRIAPSAQDRANELARVERVTQEAQRQAAQLETARIDAEKKEAQRREADRQAAAMQETAAQQEAAARQEAAAQQEAAVRQEAQRAEAAWLESARQESARLEVARQEAARLAAAAQDDARREAARRAMGRQLDEERAGREAAATAAGLPSRLALSSGSARRGRLFGRSDANAELVLYAEALARKILLNQTFDLVRDLVKQRHTDPIVTMAIRSDGSVESVTFVLSSGVVEIDEAVRRIVYSQVPYQAFTPGLTRDYDVIEIRRSWHFDTAVRLY